jgi:protein-L-isoaspartate(D-aspartate) O-methyltransferase
MAVPGAVRNPGTIAVDTMAKQLDPATERGSGAPILLQRGRRRPQIRTRFGVVRSLVATAGVALAASALAGLGVAVGWGVDDLLAATPNLSVSGGPDLDPLGPRNPPAETAVQERGGGQPRIRRPDPGRGSERNSSGGGFGSPGRVDQDDHLYPRPATGDPTVLARYAMVDQIERRGLKDRRVLAAMARVPRHRFVPEVLRDQAHADKALPIGHGQNIYQPYLVAYMTSLLDLQPGDRVLEIGTGSGYHTAVLAELAKRVYSIEIIEELGRRAAAVLHDLNYRNIELRIGDGYKGWAEAAPFDAILLTAAPPEIPQLLIDELAVGGTMVVPVGGGPVQELQVIVKTPEGLEKQFKGPFIVPPMTRNGDSDDEGTAEQP